MLFALAVAVGAGAGAVALMIGTDVGADVPLGLPDPGPVTPWALPASRLVGRLSAVVAVGGLIGAAFLAPARGQTVGLQGYRWLRTASWAAMLWGAATIAELVFALSDVVGLPASTVLRPSYFGLVLSFEPLRTLLVVLIGALVVAIASRAVLSVTGAALTAGLAIAATLPPAFAGHASGAGNHQLAVSSMVWHLAGAVIWAGGLVALLLARSLPGRELGTAASRYSRMAAWGFGLVATSGVINAVANLDLRQNPVSVLVDSGYGVLVVGKAGALCVLGLLGWWHRRHTLAALRAGRPAAFLRFAAGEIIVFAATFGLAVALARSAPPVVVAEETTAQGLLGFTPPTGPPQVGSLLLNWLPEPLYLGFAGFAVALYVIGVHRGTTAWPVARTTAWCAGWGVIALATSSGIARYAPTLFSTHLIQHLVLATAAPLLIVLARPITLAHQSLRPAPDPEWRGPREWLGIAQASLLARFLTHPAVALLLYAASLFGMYFGGLFELAQRSHAAHLGMLAHPVLTGALFYSLVLGCTPRAKRCGDGVRVALVVAGMGLLALLGLALDAAPAVGASWYDTLGLTWRPESVTDQHAAARWCWTWYQIPNVLVLLGLLTRSSAGWPLRRPQRPPAVDH